MEKRDEDEGLPEDITFLRRMAEISEFEAFRTRYNRIADRLESLDEPAEKPS